MKKVSELMAADDLHYCTTETRLASAARMMKDTNRGALPVVDSEHKVVGIITDRDIALSLAEHKAKTPYRFVNDILPKTKVHTVKTDATVTEALGEMRRNKVGRLPVTDKDGKLKGMLSVNNLLSGALQKKEELGLLDASEENLAKTIHALFERNRQTPEKTKVNREAELEAAED